jgi:hypothetical protein
MATWNDFEQAHPEMAAAGRKLLYQFGVPLGYLATVRQDGGPRVHPICPIQTEGGLYALIVPSPKRHDLLRDRRYALHTFPAVDRDDEFSVTGRARHHDDAALVARVRTAFLATGGHSTGDEMLFALDIEHALLATYKKRGEPDAFPPRYTKWRAPAARRSV